ncbi:MAG: glycosyltransferase family 4 protein [Acetobacteraceae bacterium]
MSLRVLITHERFPPDFAGGGEEVVLRTATGLMALGHQVHVLTAGDPAITSHAGVPTERLPISRYRFNLSTSTIAAAARRADLIHTFTYHACLPSLMAARRVGKPIVCEVLALFGDTWRSMRGPAIGRLFQAWERFLVTRRYDRTLFLSEPSRQIALRLGAPAEQSMVLSPGIEPARFSPDGQGDPLVLFAGRMDRRKGFHHVMAAARALPDIPFCAVGWADDLAALRSAAPANLEIVESTGNGAYVDLLKRASIFLFPSYSETYGIVVAEAMAAGCAVISSVDTIAFAGDAVAPGDEAAMIAAIRRRWDDPAGTRVLGQENLRRARSFTWEAHMDRLQAVYADMLAVSAGTHGGGSGVA